MRFKTVFRSFGPAERTPLRFVRQRIEAARIEIDEIDLMPALTQARFHTQRHLRQQRFLRRTAEDHQDGLLAHTASYGLTRRSSA
jgi:hypothetical protein